MDIETTTDPKMTARDVNVFYGDKKAIDDVSIDIATRERHRLHRPVGLRQVDLPAHASTG